MKFHQNHRKCFYYQYLTGVQIWSHLDNFQASIAIFSDFGYNMGIPIHFLPFSDESGQTFVLLMKMSQFFQETCKTKLYENSKKPGPSVWANFSEFYENLQGGHFVPPPTKIGLNSFCYRHHTSQIFPRLMAVFECKIKYRSAV